MFHLDLQVISGCSEALRDIATPLSAEGPTARYLDQLGDHNHDAWHGKDQKTNCGLREAESMEREGACRTPSPLPWVNMGTLSQS